MDSADEWAKQKTERLFNSNFFFDDNPRNIESGLPDALIGRLIDDSIIIRGFHIPLPPGRWAKIAQLKFDTETYTGDGYFLGLIEFKRLVGAVVITANKSKNISGAEYNQIAGSDRNNPHVIYSFTDAIVSPGHQDCWLISNHFTPPMQQWADTTKKLSPLERAAGSDLATKGVSYPQDFVSVKFGRAEHWGMLEVVYLVSPENEGIASSTVLTFTDSDWHANNIDRFPEKLAYIDKLKQRAILHWPEFNAYFDAAALISKN